MPVKEANTYMLLSIARQVNDHLSYTYFTLSLHNYYIKLPNNFSTLSFFLLSPSSD
jgi:hypothetical protein